MNEIVGPFTREDLQQLPNTISIIRQIARGHMGLGIPTAFKKTVATGYCACLSVGIVGVGKTKTLQAQKTICFDKWYDQDIGTLAGTKSNDQEFLSNSNVLWVTYDLSRMSEMAAENTLKVVCALLTEHQIHARTSGYEVNIQACNLSWLGACDHVMYNILWDTSQWRGNSKDRILRYHQMAYRRPKEINDAIPEPRITVNFPKVFDVRIEDREGFAQVRDMLESQFSEERAELWAKRLGQGSAALNGRDHTTWADWKYILLHRFNIEIEKSAAGRTRFTSPLVMDADALDILSHVLKYGAVSRQFLMEKSMVTDEEYANQKIDDLLGWLLEEDHATGKVLASEEIYRDHVIPQMMFEQFCLNHGREYYGFNEDDLQAAKPVEAVRTTEDFDRKKDVRIRV